MLWFNGVEAAVAINGVELPRFNVQRDNPNNTITCWIPSEAGKAFSILWSSGVNHHAKDTSARVWTDGTLSGSLFQSSCGCRDASHMHVIDRVTVSPTAAHPMVFATVDHTDYRNDNDHELAVPGNEAGQIIVTINEAKITRGIPCYPLIHPKVLGLRLSETEKKLVPHKVQLGERTLSLPSQEWCETQDTQLLAKFVFKYQPLELLIADGVAPDNLGKRKVEKVDPEVEDKNHWEAIHDSIAFLEKKMTKKNHNLSCNTAVRNLPNDDEEYDSDFERDEARLIALHNAASVLRKEMSRKGRVPAKRVKLSRHPHIDT